MTWRCCSKTRDTCSLLFLRDQTISSPSPVQWPVELSTDPLKVSQYQEKVPTRLEPSPCWKCLLVFLIFVDKWTNLSLTYHFKCLLFSIVSSKILKYESASIGTFNKEKEIVRTFSGRCDTSRSLVESSSVQCRHQDRAHVTRPPAAWTRTGVPYILISTQSQLTNWLDGQPGTGQTWRGRNGRN